MTQVLVLHRSAVVAAGLASTLQGLPDCHVRVTDDAAGDAPGAFNGIDVVVADAHMLARHQSRLGEGAMAANSLRVVLFATSASDAQMFRNLRSGASACLSIRSEPSEIIAAVRGEPQKSAVPAASAEGSGGRTLAARPVGGLPPGALRRVRQHVEEHLRDRLAMTDLAAIAGFSDCHFSRAFKQSVGVSPHRYVTQRRIECAVEMVKQSARPLTEIGLSVGFSDQSHFTRVFVSLMGETPSAYRHRHR